MGWRFPSSLILAGSAKLKPLRQRRTEWLESQGFRALRFWNNQALEEIEAVKQVIRESLDDLMGILLYHRRIFMERGFPQWTKG